MRELEQTCRDPGRNIMPVMMQALDAEVTLGEVGEFSPDLGRLAHAAGTRMTTRMRADTV